jgi:hypothetical protein
MCNHWSCIVDPTIYTQLKLIELTDTRTQYERAGAKQPFIPLTGSIKQPSNTWKRIKGTHILSSERS